ncbi:MFS transporter [Halolamina sp. CBA1230]|uniref:MFS transporter n=1 Tax=Halolamina sp. CBA1230 TaxID=1853690 RepID=UPI0020D017EF|nr:MFS transporter [Halolamina sp. CBA1230]
MILPAIGRDHPLRANRDFRRFVAGQFVTNAGDSLYTVAVLWLVFELSGSTTLVGVANAILLLPWLLQAVAGPVVDRFPVKPLLVGSQVVQGVVVLVFPLAAVAGRLDVDLLLGVVPILMLATLVMGPIEATLVPRIVADDRLSQANSALATVTLGLDMLFDAVGGGLIALFGPTALFLADAVTFALAALLFARMGVPEVAPDDAGASVRAALRSYADDMREGVEILRGTAFVELVLTTAVANFTTGVTLAVLPAFGDAVGGPAAYGLLLGALGTGRLIGSVVGPRFEGVRYGAFLIVGNGLGACAWLASVLAPSTALTVGLFGLAWVPIGVSGVLTSTLNQRLFPADRLGRVSAIKGTASGATLPLGSLLGGAVGDAIGHGTTMALAAAGFGFTAAYVFLRPRLRRLPTVASAEPADFDVAVVDER